MFEAAGWDHHGEAGVFAQELAARSGRHRGDAERGRCPRRQNSGGRCGALINVVRQLGLVYDNTIYMDNDVPAGQALLKVGKKLRK